MASISPIPGPVTVGQRIDFEIPYGGWLDPTLVTARLRTSAGENMEVTYDIENLEHGEDDTLSAGALAFEGTAKFTFGTVTDVPIYLEAGTGVSFVRTGVSEGSLADDLNLTLLFQPLRSNSMPAGAFAPVRPCAAWRSRFPPSRPRSSPAGTNGPQGPPGSSR